MARYAIERRSRWTGGDSALVVGVAALGVVIWWAFLRDAGIKPADVALVAGPPPALTTDRPEIEPQARLRPGITEKGETPRVADGSSAATIPDARRAEALLGAGKQALEQGDLVGARAYLSEAVTLGLDARDASLVRAELTRIGRETIFSLRILESDPLVSRYVINQGDSLGKIAKAHKVSDDLIASINGITDKNRIRAGQAIKVIHGPFRAVVHKKSFTIDLLLGNTLVQHFKVGLGTDGSTPTGEWRVGTKLKNPTYYPPRGGRMVAADDPQNPLGERWIGLVGVGGEALGQARYGVHGTIEPESVGRNVSLGCIRMYNEDVEQVYSYLVEKHSTVLVVND